MPTSANPYSYAGGFTRGVESGLRIVAAYDAHAKVVQDKKDREEAQVFRQETEDQFRKVAEKHAAAINGLGIEKLEAQFNAAQDEALRQKLGEQLKGKRNQAIILQSQQVQESEAILRQMATRMGNNPYNQQYFKTLADAHIKTYDDDLQRAENLRTHKQRTAELTQRDVMQRNATREAETQRQEGRVELQERKYELETTGTGLEPRLLDKMNTEVNSEVDLVLQEFEIPDKSSKKETSELNSKKERFLGSTLINKGILTAEKLQDMTNRVNTDVEAQELRNWLEGAVRKAALNERIKVAGGREIEFAVEPDLGELKEKPTKSVALTQLETDKDRVDQLIKDEKQLSKLIKSKDLSEEQRDEYVQALEIIRGELEQMGVKRTEHQGRLLGGMTTFDRPDFEQRIATQKSQDKFGAETEALMGRIGAR